MVKVSYDPEVDALYIYKEKERAAFSIEVLKDFVMDVDSSRKVIALEILNASKVLNIPKSELKNVQKGNVSTLVLKEFYGVKYSLVLKKARIESQVAVPIGARALKH